MVDKFGTWIGGDMSLKDGVTLITSGYDNIESHVRKFVEASNTPGEFALRFWNLIVAAERFEAVTLGFLNGVMVLLPQLIDGEYCDVAWTVVSAMQLLL